MTDRKSERLDGIGAREAVFSRDGRWLLYQTQPMGVYLEPFPRTGAKHQLSPAMGHPFWSTKGDETYGNRRPGRSAIVPVKIEPTVTFGQPVEIERPNRFEANPAISRRNVDAVPNSDRLIGVLTNQAGGGVTYEIRVVLNWFEELQRRVPAR